MPVTPEIGRVGRHDHEMAGARPDLLEAPRAQVGLLGLKGMDQADLQRPAQRGINAHSRITAITTKAAMTMT
jgi:hypothetical protein